MTRPWGLRMGYDFLYLGSDELYGDVQLRPSIAFQVTDRDVLGVYYQYDWLDFHNQSVANNTPADQDSHLHTFGFTWQRRVNEAFTVGIGYEGAGNISQGSDYDYFRHAALIGVGWRPNCRWTVNLTGGIQFRSYANPNFVFGINRDDEQYTGELTITRHVTDRFDIFGQASLNRNDSNILLNDFDRQFGQMGIEWRF